MAGTTVAPRQIIVTGGRGKLASVVSDYFVAPSYITQLYSRNPGQGFLALDNLMDPDNLINADTLLHLAWSTLPATSEQAGGIEWQSDMPNLERLLGTLAQVPVTRRPHLIFFSSGGAVYGNAPGRPNVENDICQPIGTYGRAKRAAEMMIERLSAQHQLATTILRISNPYGYPVPANRAQGIIPHAVRCAREGQALTLWGDGHARKDFLHHTDFLAALEAVITRGLTGTFNLSSGESHSVLEIIALVEKYTGIRVSLNRIPGHTWDVADSRLSPVRLTQATGWRPMISLEEGIRRATRF